MTASASAPEPVRGRPDPPPALAQPGTAPAPKAAETRVEPALEHPDRRAAAVAAGQRGLITTSQLAAVGIRRGALAVRARHGRLHRVHREVYAVGVPASDPATLELAAVLACARSAVISHGSAAFAWGIVDRRPPRIHLTVAGPHRVRLEGVTCHTAPRLEPRDRALRDGLPVTGAARTVLDLAAVLAERDLRWAVEEARVRRLVTGSELAVLLARTPGRRGAGRLRRVLATLEGDARITRSEAERRLHDLVRRAGLPPARANARVVGHEVDLLWPDAALVAEVDGFAFHGSRAAFERDRRRDAELQAAGYRVVRVTWRRLTEEPEAVAVMLARLLERA
jgi:very-short-patch-repair endonuclease